MAYIKYLIKYTFTIDIVFTLSYLNSMNTFSKAVGEEI